LLKLLAKGEYKYSIGIVLIDFGRKQVKTIDTNVYTESEHILKLYPLSLTTFVVYEEKKGIVLIVSNTQPIQKITLGKTTTPTITTTTTTTTTSSTTTTTTTTTHTSTTMTTKTTTTSSTTSSTTKTPNKPSQGQTELPLLAMIAIAIVVIMAIIIVLKKK